MRYVRLKILDNFLVYQSPWQATRPWWLKSPISTFAVFSKLVSLGNCQLRSVDYVLQREIENNSSCKRVRSLKISSNRLLYRKLFSVFDWKLLAGSSLELRTTKWHLSTKSEIHNLGIFPRENCILRKWPEVRWPQRMFSIVFTK